MRGQQTDRDYFQYNERMKEVAIKCYKNDRFELSLNVRDRNSSDDCGSGFSRASSSRWEDPTEILPFCTRWNAKNRRTVQKEEANNCMPNIGEFRSDRRWHATRKPVVPLLTGQEVQSDKAGDKIIQNQSW